MEIKAGRFPNHRTQKWNREVVFHNFMAIDAMHKLTTREIPQTKGWKLRNERRPR